MRKAAFALLVSPAACATEPATFVAVNSSYSAATDVLADAVATYATSTLRVAPERNIVVVAPASEQMIAPRVRDLLTIAGFHVVEKANKATAHKLSFQITQLDGNVLVRVFLDQDQASRLYVRNNAGGLQPAGSYIVVRAAA